MKTYPWETIRERVRTLVRVTPAPLRRFLIEEMAQALDELALKLPTADRSLCACGRRLHPNARQVEVELTELDFSVGYQTAGLADLDGEGLTAFSSSKSTDQHTIGFMCPGCGRIYRMPQEIEVSYT